MPKADSRRGREDIMGKLVRDGQALRVCEAEDALRTEKHRKMRLNGTSALSTTFSQIHSIRTQTAKSNVVNRKFELSQAQVDNEVADNIVECPKCHDFSLWHCSHSNRTDSACHHYRVLKVAGAYSGNDKSSARAAVGIVWGQDIHSQYSHTITLDYDLDEKSTTQRAEIWAASWGLQFFATIVESNARAGCHHRISKPSEWLIATSSDYVVEGMTKRLPLWKVRWNPSLEPICELIRLPEEWTEDCIRRFACEY